MALLTTETLKIKSKKFFLIIIAWHMTEVIFYSFICWLKKKIIFAFCTL